MKTVNIYGSTGSIGTQSLNVIRKNRDKFKVIGLTAEKNLTLLEKQITEFSPEFVFIKDKKKAEYLKNKYGIDVFYGENGLIDFASYKKVDISLIGISGIAGILPTYTAIQYSKRIALANKESLVSAGEFIINKAKKNNTEIIPVDSEHSAIFQCLMKNQKKYLRKIILTASGGPFWSYPKEKFREINVEDALKHPTWKMGKKITIDSATLMNKGLEIIEAKWLFNVTPDKIDVIIHPQSIIHSMVEYSDGSIIAQLGIPSMEIPISYALFYPERAFLEKSLDITSKSLTFFKPDFEKFPTLNFAYEALKRGKGYPAGLNMANELAVNAFLKRKIKFYEIFEIIEKIFDFKFLENFTKINDVFRINEEIKKRIKL